MTETLSAYWYTDPDNFDYERQGIFLPTWWLLGPAHDVAGIGDYLCDTICGWPVFAMRSADGQLRAFFNICRHRGARLVPPGSGNIESIRCPYHGWLYDHSGRLVNAPNFGISLDAKCYDLALEQVDVHVWNGLVFVNLDRNRSHLFEHWIADLAEICEPFAIPAELEFQDRFDVTGNLNWKTYCENTVEGYHLNLIHPRLAKTLATGSVDLWSANDGRGVIFDVCYGTAGNGKTLRGETGRWVYLFPNLQLVLGEKIFKAERIEPLCAGTVRSTNWAWYSHLLSPDEKKDAFQWARQIVEEDFGVCEQVTANMHSGVFKPGPLSPKMESHVMRFQELVQQYLEVYLSRLT